MDQVLLLVRTSFFSSITCNAICSSFPHRSNPYAASFSWWVLLLFCFGISHIWGRRIEFSFYMFSGFVILPSVSYFPRHIFCKTSLHHSVDPHIFRFQLTSIFLLLHLPLSQHILIITVSLLYFLNYDGHTCTSLLWSYFFFSDLLNPFYSRYHPSQYSHLYLQVVLNLSQRPGLSYIH